MLVTVFLLQITTNTYFPTNSPHFTTIPFFSFKIMLALSKKQTTMKKILLFALMAFFVQTSFCQNLSDTVNVEYSKNSPSRWSLGIGIPTTGLSWILSPNLNNFLREKGIPTRNYTGSIPLNLSYQVNKFKFNIEANYGIMNYPFSEGVYKTSLNSSVAIISTEYALFADRNNYLYVNLGIGHADYIQTITVSSSQPTTFVAALQTGSSGQTIILKNSSAFLDFGLEFSNRTKQNSVGQSFKIGYRYGLESSQWQSQLVKLFDTPYDRVNSFYLQALLNIPSRRNFKNQKNSKNN